MQKNIFDFQRFWTYFKYDFKQMGRLAAEMILEKRLSKVHCDFRMTRRSTF